MLNNQIKERRAAQGWSQQALADSCGVSRSEISAIEIGRLSPSAETALRLARAFSCAVEDLFWEGDAPRRAAEWAWDHGATGRYWIADAPAGPRRYPVEPLGLAEFPADLDDASAPGACTLLLATCDPAAGLLVHALAARQVRCLPFTRSSREGLDLLARGLVHVAAIHLGRTPRENARAMRRALGRDFFMIHLARWEEGLAHDPSLQLGSMQPGALLRRRWVGRPVGSGARQCADELLGGRVRKPSGYDRCARDHRGVAEAIRMGFAEVGVCVRLAAESAGLGFRGIATESLDLCLRADQWDSPPVRALLAVLRNRGFRDRLGGLPGYDVRGCGERVA